MKITKSQLKQIIKEELGKVLSEANTPESKIAFFQQKPKRWRDSVQAEYQDMANGGDGGGIRQELFPNWSNEDFQKVINAMSRV